MLSGSKITHEQFHLLRVIWPLIQRRSKLIEDLHKYGLLQAWGVASGILDNSAEFKKFLNHLDGGETVQHLAENDARMPGSFWAISRYQDQITSPIRMTSTAPTLAPTFPTPKMTLRKRASRAFDTMFSSPDVQMPSAPQQAEPVVQDEAVVNTYLLLLLDRLGSLVSHSASEWLVNHVNFTAEFEKASFTTITDGSLFRRLSGDVQAIVEVKRQKRGVDTEALQMQESAEMVGWVLQNSNYLPDLNNQYVLCFCTL
jgi:hypothetical protein